MKELEERILRDGRDLGNGILKVDSFINHQVNALIEYNEQLYGTYPGTSIDPSVYPKTEGRITAQ